jgi:hypothetical protein
MRRLLAVITAVGLLAGPAIADANMRSPHWTGTSTVRLPRWGFTAAGTPVQIQAERRCKGVAFVESRRHRASDVALGVLTLGIYTPLHATYRCAVPTPIVG